MDQRGCQLEQFIGIERFYKVEESIGATHFGSNLVRRVIGVACDNDDVDVRAELPQPLGRFEAIDAGRHPHIDECNWILAYLALSCFKPPECFVTLPAQINTCDSCPYRGLFRNRFEQLIFERRELIVGFRDDPAENLPIRRQQVWFIVHDKNSCFSKMAQMVLSSGHSCHLRAVHRSYDPLIFSSGPVRYALTIQKLHYSLSAARPVEKEALHLITTRSA